MKKNKIKLRLRSGILFLIGIFKTFFYVFKAYCIAYLKFKAYFKALNNFLDIGSQQVVDFFYKIILIKENLVKNKKKKRKKEKKLKNKKKEVSLGLSSDLFSIKIIIILAVSIIYIWTQSGGYTQNMGIAGHHYINKLTHHNYIDGLTYYRENSIDMRY